MQSGHVIREISADATVSEPQLLVRKIQASLSEGSLEGNAQVDFARNAASAYQVGAALGFKNFDPSIFSKKSSGSFPVRGLFDGQFNLSGKGNSLEAALDQAEGDILLTGRNGVLTAFELDNRSQLVLVGAGILGQQLNRPGVTALSQAVPYFKDMRFENFTLRLTRGADKKVQIPELKFLGDSLRIDGQGFIAASSLSEVLDQPLKLSLGLGAKGRLIDYLETLQLLGPNTSADGFRDWKKAIDIGGTLGKPDTTALNEMLNAAALRAVKGSKAESTPAATSGDANTTAQEGQLVLPGQTNNQPVEQPKKSNEEKLADDIEMGLDLLNSVFGN